MRKDGCTRCVERLCLGQNVDGQGNALLEATETGQSPREIPEHTVQATWSPALSKPSSLTLNILYSFSHKVCAVSAFFSKGMQSVTRDKNHLDSWRRYPKHRTQHVRKQVRE